MTEYKAYKTVNDESPIPILKSQKTDEMNF